MNREFSFTMDKELFRRNVTAFVEKAVEYKISYSITMHKTDVGVTVIGDDLVKLCTVVGILNYEKE